MSQRINAARVVVSVNMKSRVTDPRPGSTQAQTRRQNNPGLRSVHKPGSPSVDRSGVEPLLPSPDRRMSRRKPSNQGIIPLDLLGNRAEPSPPVQAASATLEAVPIQTRPETKWPGQSQTSADDYNTALASSPITTVSARLDAQEFEDAYINDRPVYLLSQKYFGTRY